MALARGLTQKQEKFVQELIKGKSQREAYKFAYDAKKMSDNAIDREASLLLKSPKVAQRFKEIRSKVIKRAENKAIIAAEEIIKEIVSIAKDDISNYLDFRTEKVLAGYEDGEPVFEYRPIIEMKDSRKIDTKNVSEVSLGANGSFKFKTYCRDTALYKLAEILGVNELQKARQKLLEDRFVHDKEIDKKKYW